MSHGRLCNVTLGIFGKCNCGWSSDAATPTAGVEVGQPRGLRPLAPEGIDSVDVLSEGACPECGGDIMARTKGGLFLDSDRAWCNECGFQGQVTTDSETPAYFDYHDPAPASVEAGPSRGADAPLAPEGIAAPFAMGYSGGRALVTVSSEGVVDIAPDLTMEQARTVIGGLGRAMWQARTSAVR